MKNLLRNLIIFQLVTLITIAPSSLADLPEIKITEERTALKNPISTFNSLAAELRYEPLVDLQERNVASAQSDITIRGGIFENTGIRIGAATLFDPQTGHYTAEIPISPFMLSSPEILTGLDNSVYGFNSAVGTINYGWKEINDNVNLRASAGTHNLNVQHAYAAKAGLFNTDIGIINFDLDAARSEISGTRPGGSHNFERFGGRLQLVDKNRQTDLFVGYQDKFFTWPFLYALEELHDLVGSSGIETESLQTTLVTLNHRQEFNDKDYIELTGYYRRHKDDYEFDRAQPGLFNDFIHESDVYTFGLEGFNEFDIFDIAYSGQYVAEELDSTSLTFGDFTSRSLGEVAVVPEKTFVLDSGDTVKVKAGVGYEDSDRNSSNFSPVTGVYYNSRTAEKDLQEQYYVEYAESSQLPGYTAIASNPDAGLFRSNPSLTREQSQNFELGYKRTQGRFSLQTATFYRQDNDLVDWTFDSSITPFASRSANNVDIDVFGLEVVAGAKWDSLDLVTSYSFLKKNEDFGLVDVDGSFYALNFPEHRATTAITYRPSQQVEIRIDNEYRIQEDNPLRNSDDDVIFTAAEVIWRLPYTTGLALNFAVDNLWKSNFEDIPGVPGRGRLFSIGLEYQL